MKAGSLLSHPLRLLSLIILISLTHRTLLAGDNNQINGCIDMAIEKILKIRSLPEKKYLKTLDDQVVLYKKFNTKCQKYSPSSTQFEKFYNFRKEFRN